MKPPEKKCEETEDWLLTYSDMVTLLLTFFILLVSISKIDAVQFEAVKTGIHKGMGKEDLDRPLDALKESMKEIVQALQIEKVANIGHDHDGIVIEFASSIFYQPGSAELKPEATKVMQTLAGTLSEPRYANFQVEVQGHTDDQPIHTAQFPSNWELSAARATGVVRHLIGYGVEPKRMKAIGFADIAPKVSNRGPEGQPIPINQEINRRIAVRMYPR